MVLVERLRRIEMLCNTLKRMSKTWGLDSGAANCLTPPSFCWELQHLSGLWPAGWWFEEDDRGAAFGIRAWNKQALRQEGPVLNGALDSSPIPKLPPGTVELFHLPASHSQQPAFLQQPFPTIHMCTRAHRKSHFPILIFNSLCDARSEDLVPCAALPAAWLCVPLTGQAAASSTALV